MSLRPLLEISVLLEEKRRRVAEAWSQLFGEDEGTERTGDLGHAVPSITVSGGTVIVGNGNVHNVFNVRPSVSPIQPHAGVIDAGQKARLLELRDQIVSVSRALAGC